MPRIVAHRPMMMMMSASPPLSPYCPTWTQEYEVQEGGDDRLGGLHDVAEGHGAGEEGDDRTHVGREVAERGGRLGYDSADEGGHCSRDCADLLLLLCMFAFLSLEMTFVHPSARVMACCTLSCGVLRTPKALREPSGSVPTRAQAS